MYKRKPFLNIYIDLASEALFADLDTLFANQTAQIISLNMEQVVLAADDTEFRKIINESELIIADGVSIVWTYKLLSSFKSEKCLLKKLAGIDLAAKLIESKQKIALWGAKKEVIELLEKKFAGKLVFAEQGYFNSDRKTQIIDRLIKSQPDLLLVAMGAPLQEKLIYECKSKLSNCICMGVGGAFDVWSDQLKRAPQWMISLNLEWLFRLIQEPYRLKRFLYNVYRYTLLLIYHLRGKLT